MPHLLKCSNKTLDFNSPLMSVSIWQLADTHPLEDGQMNLDELTL